MPRFIGSAVNRWSVHSLAEDRCVVRMRATLELQGPMAMLGWLLRRRMQADGARVGDELRHWVEEGRPHPRKVEAAAKASRAL